LPVLAQTAENDSVVTRPPAGGGQFVAICSASPMPKVGPTNSQNHILGDVGGVGGNPFPGF